MSPLHSAGFKFDGKPERRQFEGPGRGRRNFDPPAGAPSRRPAEERGPGLYLVNSPVATADCASFRRVGANYGPRRVRIGGLALGFHDARALAVRSAKMLALEGSAAGARPC